MNFGMDSHPSSLRVILDTMSYRVISLTHPLQMRSFNKDTFGKSFGQTFETTSTIALDTSSNVSLIQYVDYPVSFKREQTCRVTGASHMDPGGKLISSAGILQLLLSSLSQPRLKLSGPASLKHLKDQILNL